MRWIVRVLVSLVLLVVLFVGAIFLLPAEKIGALVSQQVEKATGRQLTMAGRLVPSVWPEPGLRTGAVSLSNAEWATDAPMLAAEGLSVGLDLTALLSGQIKLREITILRPEIRLERHSDGRANWLLVAPSEGAAAPGASASQPGNAPTAAPSIETFAIQGGRLRYIDHGSGEQLDLRDVSLALSAPDPAQPVQVEMSGTLRGQEFATSLQIGALSALLSGQVSPLAFSFNAGGALIGFDGRAGIAPLAATGALEATIGDLQPLFALVGTEPPELPAGFGREVAFRAETTLAPEGSVHLRDLEMQIDGNQITGALDLLPGDRPKLVGRLEGGALNLVGLLPAAQHSDASGGGSASSATPASGWPKTPIDIAPLAMMEAELSIAAQSVDLGVAQLGRLRSLITLTDRRLVATIHELRAFEGQITGNMVMNGRGSLSVGGDLTAQGIGLKPLLATFAGFERLTGTGDFTLSYLGVGSTVDAIMHSLKGQSRATLGPGVLSGINVSDRWRRPNAPPQSDTQTVFNGAAASFQIDGGVARTSDFTLSSDKLSATGKGTVALGPQTLDMLLTPRTVAQTEGQGALVLPLKVRGPWAAPKLSVDLDELAKQQWQAQSQERKDKAEERVQKEVSRALGVERETGETVEDAVRRELREKARKELQKLFKKD